MFDVYGLFVVYLMNSACRRIVDARVPLKNIFLGRLICGQVSPMTIH